MTDTDTDNTRALAARLAYRRDNPIVLHGGLATVGLGKDELDTLIAALELVELVERVRVEELSSEDKDIAIAQAVEFAEYVEGAAKGAMVERARHFLSLPYSQELRARLAALPIDTTSGADNDAR